MRAKIAAAALVVVAAIVGAGNAGAQGVGSQGETPGHQGKLTKLPKLVHFVEAEYPESEKAANKSASVVLQIAIDDHGVVTDATVLQSAGPAFDQAALVAVKQFKFEPAEVDGKPAPVKITYRYDFVLKVEPKTPVVNYDGVVQNRFDKKPIVGATIEIEGVGKAQTDEQGHFEFKEVPLGKHVVTISGPGLTPVSTEENLEKGKKLSVKYSLEPQENAPEGEKADVEIVVVAPKIKKEVVTTEIKAEEGKKVAGTGGDTLRVVQNLPGVARASAGSGALVVWGAAPNDTRIYVDGVRIPLLYHVGGMRSTVNSDLVRAIDLAPGGYGSEYGRGLGGLVKIDTRALRSDRFHGYVAADLIDTSGLIEAPVDEHTRFAIAGRKSYLKNTLDVFTKKDVGEFVPIPDYYDAQIKVARDLRQNETVEVIGLISRDTLTRTLANVDPAQVKTQDTLTSFNRLGLSYHRQLEEGSTMVVVPWAGQEHSRTLSSFGGNPTSLDSHGWTGGVRAYWRGKLSEKVGLIVGVDSEASTATVARRGSVTLPPREGDISVFGQPPGESVNADQWHAAIGSIAPYAEWNIALAEDRLHVVPGIRIEPFIISGSRQTPISGNTPSVGFAREVTTVQPRLNVVYQLTPRLSVKGALGYYEQAPEAEDLSAVFGNPTLSISQARHLLGGYTFKLVDDLSLEQVVFYSHSSALPTRDASESPLLARALVQDGEGRAFGAQFLLRKELSAKWFGWISYTIMRAERKDHPNDQWRLFDFDQTHVATIVASYNLGLGFELGSRLRFATGYPRTPVVDSFYDSRRDLFEPIFGPQNSIRVPNFVELDVRLAKRFESSWGKGEIFLDVQNVTDRANPEEIVYNYDYTKRGYITGLPILPVLGGRFEW